MHLCATEGDYLNNKYETCDLVAKQMWERGKSPRNNVAMNQGVMTG